MQQRLLSIKFIIGILFFAFLATLSMQTAPKLKVIEETGKLLGETVMTKGETMVILQPITEQLVSPTEPQIASAHGIGMMEGTDTISKDEIPAEPKPNLSSQSSYPQERFKAVFSRKFTKNAENNQSFLTNWVLSASILRLLRFKAARALAILVVQFLQFILAFLAIKALIKLMKIKVSRKTQFWLKALDITFHIAMAVTHEIFCFSDFLRIAEFGLAITMSICLAYYKRERDPLPNLLIQEE